MIFIILVIIISITTSIFLIKQRSDFNYETQNQNFGSVENIDYLVSYAGPMGMDGQFKDSKFIGYNKSGEILFSRYIPLVSTLNDGVKFGSKVIYTEIIGCETIVFDLNTGESSKMPNVVEIDSHKICLPTFWVRPSDKYLAVNYNTGFFEWTPKEDGYMNTTVIYDENLKIIGQLNLKNDNRIMSLIINGETIQGIMYALRDINNPFTAIYPNDYDFYTFKSDVHFTNFTKLKVEPDIMVGYYGATNSIVYFGEYFVNTGYQVVNIEEKQSNYPTLTFFNKETGELVNQIEYDETNFLPRSLLTYENRLFVLDAGGKMKIYDKAMSEVESYSLNPNPLYTENSYGGVSNIAEGFLVGSKLIVHYDKAEAIDKAADHYLKGSLREYDISTGKEISKFNLTVPNTKNAYFKWSEVFVVPID